jgi:hypothetical protein
VEFLGDGRERTACLRQVGMQLHAHPGEPSKNITQQLHSATGLRFPSGTLDRFGQRVQPPAGSAYPVQHRFNGLRQCGERVGNVCSEEPLILSRDDKLDDLRIFVVERLFYRILERAPEEPERLFVVQDRKLRIDARLEGVFLEQARAETVDGAYIGCLDFAPLSREAAAHERFDDAALHLPCGLFGKCDDEDLIYRRAEFAPLCAGLNDPNEPFHKHAGLSRAGARGNADVPIQDRNRAKLAVGPLAHRGNYREFANRPRRRAVNSTPSMLVAKLTTSLVMSGCPRFRIAGPSQ